MSQYRGRGATFNPENRFHDAVREAADDGWASADPATDDATVAPRVGTTVSIQQARTIIARNDSPDIGFNQSINPYQGCEHGCIYCYARPTHAYLDLSPGLDFETRLFAKPNAPALLREALARPGYKCEHIAMGTNTDPYQPIEREWRITRQILEVLAEFDHPVTILTKSALIERDLDILAPMARKNLAHVAFSITTLDRELHRRMEPRAAAPERRLAAVKACADAGIPVGVMVAPVIPQLNDCDMEPILEAAAAHGATTAGWVMIKLPHEVKDLFKDWLAEHYPLRAAHVMSVIRQVRNGRENDPRFGFRARGEGPFAALMARRFDIACRRLGLNGRHHALDSSLFRPPRPPNGSPQLDLFA